MLTIPVQGKRPSSGPSIGSALPFVGGIFSGLSARRQNKRNIALAREQMAFQERMSSTAHQREVEDLKKAGLNPILSATGGPGASTPSGQTATTVNEADSAISSALALKRQNADLKLIREQTRTTKNQGYKNTAEESEIRARTRLIETNLPKASLFEDIWSAISSMQFKGPSLPKSKKPLLRITKRK